MILTGSDYFHKEQWVERGYAQALFLDAYTDRGTTPVEMSSTSGSTT